MLKNYFKMAWRTMVKDRTYAFINICGLTIGLASCMLVVTVVIDEFSYDKFWNRSSDIYKVYEQREWTTGDSKRHLGSSKALGQAMKDNFPEVEQSAEIYVEERRIRLDEKNFDGTPVKFLIADTNATAMLDFVSIDDQLPPYVAGQSNLLITESFRDRYFKGEDPVGKVLADLPSWNKEAEQFVVTGVIQDIPSNTHLRADVVMLNTPGNRTLSKDGVWGTSSVYYLLRQGTDPAEFGKKMNVWIENYASETKWKLPVYGLLPISDIYLDDGEDDRNLVKGNRTTLMILSGVGILLFLIACINFINLSTARSIKRLKETGVRKVLGAARIQLAYQFLTESLLFFIISTTLALGIYALALPIIERFIDHTLTFSLLGEVWQLILAFVIITMTSILVGAYPAWILSGTKPSNSLRGKLSGFHLFDVGLVRKTLVVVQFGIAVVVLVSLLVVWHQNQYLATKDIGYDKDNLLHIGLRQWEGKGETFKQELKKLPGIEAVSIAGWSPSTGSTVFYGSMDNPMRPDEKIEVHYIISDFDFIPTLGLKLLEGRLLDEAYESDHYDMFKDFSLVGGEAAAYRSSRAIIVTQSTANMLGIERPGSEKKADNLPVVGILKDFHRESLHKKLGPVIIFAERNPDYARLFVRTTPGMEQQAQASLAKAWKMFYPDRLLDAQWVSDILDRQYQAEHKQQTLFTFFSGLMLFLSALGIFGLIVHATEQRTKEIGIRKVLGASGSGIVAMLSKDFVKLVLISIVIASPIAWWAMNKWLEDFAYRIDVEWWIFALAGLLTILIALFTVSGQAIRAAVANPVDSLRDE